MRERLLERESRRANELPTVPGPLAQPFLEPHYTVAQIAEAWGLGRDVVRRVFEKEPGVLLLEADRPRFGKRRYRTLRIPASVVERVHQRLSVVQQADNSTIDGRRK